MQQRLGITQTAGAVAAGPQELRRVEFSLCWLVSTVPLDALQCLGKLPPGPAALLGRLPGPILHVGFMGHRWVLEAWMRACDVNHEELLDLFCALSLAPVSCAWRLRSTGNSRSIGLLCPPTIRWARRRRKSRSCPRRTSSPCTLSQAELLV